MWNKVEESLTTFYTVILFILQFNIELQRIFVENKTNKICRYNRIYFVSIFVSITVYIEIQIFVENKTSKI